MLDGVEYEEILRQEESGLCFGKELPYYFSGPDVPYGIVMDGHNYLHLSAYGSGWHSFSIRGSGKLIHKLDSKYIDLPTNLATTDDVQEAVDVVNEGKMNAENPVGTGSFSMNRKAGTVIGNYSHAEGYGTTASGIGSHAEGYGTTAPCDYSHVEGRNNIIDFDYTLIPITFGNTSMFVFSKSAPYYLSTEYEVNFNGEFVLINPILVDGNTLKSQWKQYAGYYVLFNQNFSTNGSRKIYRLAKDISSGQKSLCMLPGGDTGNFTNNYEYVFYSKPEVWDVRITYYHAHIVGNGISDAERSNAYTLDWNGVGWFQGGLQVGGNAQDDGAKNVLLEGDAIPIPENATVGQTISVKSVDENGKPVEWETTNISTSGGSGCVVSDTAPEDISVLWIDTGDNSSDENLGGGNADLGVTGATVGQTVKISAVDENGVPTAWESVDFPSGAGWRLIADITLEEEVKSVDISTDMDGNPFALGAYYLIAKTVPAVNTEDRFTYVKINTNGVASMNNIIYDTTAKNTIYLSDFCILVGNVNPIHFAGAYDAPYNWGYSIMSMSPYHMSVKMDSIKKITICPNDYSKVFGGAGTEIKLYGIDI